MELAVRDVVHGRPVKNREALANPEALDQYRDRPELEDLTMDNAVILSACRTPIGSFGGAFKDLSAADLGAVVIREAIARADVNGGELGDVIMGCVLQAGAGMNVARQAALKAGVPVEVPAETDQSRLRVRAAGGRARGRGGARPAIVDLVVAGGTESMSNAPYLMKGARWGYRMGNAEVVDSMLHEGLTCAINGCHMGMTAEEVAKRFGVSRADQDAFAAESQARAEKAIASGVFDREIVAGRRCRRRRGRRSRSRATNIRAPGRRPRSSRRCKAAFTKDGSVTAGNASGINDGAAALVIGHGGMGRKATADARWRRMLSYCTTGVDPMIMGMGPVEAMRKAVDRAGLRWRTSTS